tara:strand:+ start:49 stop:1137 length:1089 start_codon:yes stop_codon:yes gene_type:complete
MRVGLIARSDKTGLGNQTRNLARMLRPDEVMLIDSSVFNRNEQYPEAYATYSVMDIKGFPTNQEVIEWLRGLDVVVTCEIFYNRLFVDLARQMGVKTINQYNWEFADYLISPELAKPDMLVSPSHWHINEARRIWHNVEYLPTPVFVDDFNEVREHNSTRTGKKRFLHIMGRSAANDRNGTQDVIQAMRYSRGDFELVIKTQGKQDELINKFNDPRITVDTSSPENEVELYRGFDALIMPRRYGGQCLPMSEALCAGMPVIMTMIPPNDTILPRHWLIPSKHDGRFMARTLIDLYTVNHYDLGHRMDLWANKDLRDDKVIAYNIGYREFSNYELEQKWDNLINEVYRKPESHSTRTLESSTG